MCIKTEKSRRFAFTAWRKPVPRRDDMTNFLVYQTEFTQTGNIHYQCYVEFKNSYSILQVKNIYKDKTMHVEIANKSREMNMMYCTKPKSFAGERFFKNYITLEEYYTKDDISPPNIKLELDNHDKDDEYKPTSKESEEFLDWIEETYAEEYKKKHAKEVRNNK